MKRALIRLLSVTAGFAPLFYILSVATEPSAPARGSVTVGTLAPARQLIWVPEPPAAAPYPARSFDAVMEDVLTQHWEPGQ